MALLRPLPRPFTRLLSIAALVVWGLTMALLVHRSYVQASASLATDLARYGSEAQWRGVYYRGEKIGFTVSQTVATDDGFELQEDGQLEMSLLGATTRARIRTTARVDQTFVLRSFEFSLDPGTGATIVRGRIDGRRLLLEITTAGGTRTDARDLPEAPMLTLNLARRLADAGLVPGARYRWTVLDPATLQQSPIEVEVGRRENVRTGGWSIPAFKVNLAFAGLETTSWVTDTGEVVREESPLGLISVREEAWQARLIAVPMNVRNDLYEAAAVVPETTRPISEPRDVRRLRLRLDGVDLSNPDVQGGGQTVEGNIVEIRDARELRPVTADERAPAYLAAEPLIESDDASIRAEADLAVRGVIDDRARAEQLTRHVNAILEKKPTVSLPSAREVLRTRVGDCNEHTALYVAMARSVGIPARIAVGLTAVRGAFYYHAWPEVYIADGASRGYWLPVDPTLNQFPADATHVRLARGGLAKQTVILPLIRRMKMVVLDLELAPQTTAMAGPTRPPDLRTFALPLPPREAGGCWQSLPSLFRRSRPGRRPATPAPSRR